MPVGEFHNNAVLFYGRGKDEPFEFPGDLLDRRVVRGDIQHEFVDIIVVRSGDFDGVDFQEDGGAKPAEPLLPSTSAWLFTMDCRSAAALDHSRSVIATAEWYRFDTAPAEGARGRRVVVLSSVAGIMPNRTVLWFRRDLRLGDNPAIAAAAAEGEVVPLFVVDPAFARSGAPRRAFMAEALAALDVSMGRALVYRHGDPADVVPAFAAEVGAGTVFVADDFGPYGRIRDDTVAARLQRDGRAIRTVGSPYVVSPGSVRKADGSPYSVFTPFHRRWVEQLDVTRQEGGNVHWYGAPAVRSDGPPGRPTSSCDLPEASEAEASRLLDKFVNEGGADRYEAQRDRPGVDGTSRLSAYLRWGIVHPRQVLARLPQSPSTDVFRSELGWREFYADVLARRPETAWQNLQPRMNTIRVDSGTIARNRFAIWAEGRTGYPIVDAGIRQMLGTGWMHNRVRMIVASFLVKDLHLPWQWGARHFLQHLVDGDLASNNHGWQWCAGTGTDAAPYFRIFNPISQSERFDPDGAYLRRWVPELADVNSRDIHAPWQSKHGVPLGYLPPLVDHATERAEALARYNATR